MLDSRALDRVFQALADPTRRAFLERLELGPATVSELAAPLAISLAAVLQHVQVLEASGLVRTEKTGRTRTCQLQRNALADAERWLEARRLVWDRLFARLEDGEGLDPSEEASKSPATEQ